VEENFERGEDKSKKLELVDAEAIYTAIPEDVLEGLESYPEGTSRNANLLSLQI